MIYWSGMRYNVGGWLAALLLMAFLYWGMQAVTKRQHERCVKQLALAKTSTDTLLVVTKNDWCHLE